MKDSEFCNSHVPDAGSVEPLVAVPRLAELDVPEGVDVLDALEGLAGQAVRLADFYRRLVEATPPESPYYERHLREYRAALREGSKLAESFGKRGPATQRSEERALLGRLVAEVLVTLIGRFVPVERQEEARQFAKAKLVELGNAAAPR